MILFLEDPAVIAEKVARQMGLTIEEAIYHMENWDEMSIQTFRVGNSFPRKELH
jgi:hypothetical protein